MKILNINISDTARSGGGSAVAAFRLHEALLQNGIDSRMLVAYKNSDINSIIILLNKNIMEKLWNKLSKIIFIVLDNLSLVKYKKTISKNFGLFSPQIIPNKKLVKIINEINPDIVHLHWICFNFLSIEDIAKINAPIVWSLHDMWAFTGGCHLVAEAGVMCDKYTKNCGCCDFLGSKKSKDLSFRILQRKKKAFAKIKSMTIIGVSRWMADCAKKSAVFSDKKVVCLPNPINVNVFKPIDKFQSRMLWNLPKDKKLVLFGAVAVTSTPYKGFTELIEALNKINTENIEFIVFGSSRPKTPPNLPHKIRYLGHLSDDVSLVSLYSACDVMVVPSKREAFGQTASESLSCGTPVVAFRIGGLPDIIDHKINGYLAQPFDTFDLAKGIDWVLNSKNYYKLSENARQKVVREFDYGVVVKKYIELYEEVLRTS
ncbi:MAG: glycosyltransferase family 4 protein [Chitinivibrionia bacterium]|nr:glycosyltransferase family 4 protein [Chitinivibrionia bacterium]